jgi:glycosyltransferase involved in cell wall biosynthesis
LEPSTTIAPHKVLVIVPAYNEAARIGGAIQDLRRHAPWADVVVVNDGSGDDTARAARDAGAAVLSLPFNLGVGGAMQTGYLYAARLGYEVAVQFDGDGQHCAEEIASLVEPILAGRADLAIGSRMLGERQYRFSLLRWVGSRMLVGMLWLLTGRRVLDPTSGFRAASRRMIRFFSQHYPQDYLSDTVEALAEAAWHGMQIVELPAKMRMTRTSSINNIKGLIHMARICVALVIDRIEKPYPAVEDSPMGKTA